MITAKRYNEVFQEIRNSIRETLNGVRENNFENYILYIAEGDYNNRINSEEINPYVIDNRLDVYKDSTRLNYLIFFLNEFYKFDKIKVLQNNENRIYQELMIYCHIWESKPYLKKLYRFSTLLDETIDYPWEVDVPDMSKHDFIRNSIKVNFDKANNNLSKIMKEGFHSSLRNAFAHSEFSFNTHKSTISLSNYKGNDSWELRDITYDDWNERFCYSVLLCYHLLNESYEDRRNIVKLTGKNEFEIKHKRRDRSYFPNTITYNSESEMFRFKILH